MISIRNTSLNMFEYVISIIDEQWFQLSANNVWVNPQVLFPTTVNIEVSSHDLLSHILKFIRYRQQQQQQRQVSKFERVNKRVKQI